MTRLARVVAPLIRTTLRSVETGGKQSSWKTAITKFTAPCLQSRREGSMLTFGRIAQARTMYT